MAWIYWNETEWLISLSSDGESWITIADKNLGATEVYNDWDTLSEANCWKYFQRWNNYGFPFTGAVTTSSTQVNAQNYWPWNYYSSSTFIIGSIDWSSVQNDNLRWWVTWTNEAMQWPCNTGYHVPSKDENGALVTAMTTLGIDTSNWNCMKIYLKMPFAGYRDSYAAGVYHQGTYGHYWSAYAYSTNNANSLRFNSSTLYPQSWTDRAHGFSLRPFANTPVVPDYNDTWDTLYWDELPDRPEPPKPKLKRIVKHNNYYFFWEAPIHVSGITLNKSSIILNNAWETEQLTATVTPEDAVNKKVLWSSSDTSIATVSSTGLVTCVTPGECTITATCADWWASASCNTVQERTFTVTFTEASNPESFNPTYSDDATWLTPWDTAFDEFFGYSAVRLSTAWVETAEITQAQSGWNGKLDITQLWTLTSGDNVMIKFPVRWIKMSKSWSTVTLSITDAIWKESDWYQYYAFQKTWDIEANASATVETYPLYLWTYLSYTDTWNVLKSWSDKTPQWNFTMGNAITYAWNNGTWYTISWWYQRELINAYYMMKYGNPDSQTVVGRWYVDAVGTSSPIVTWWTNSQWNATYWEATWQYSMKLFWLEDWRGNQTQLVGWLFTDSNRNLYTAIHSFTANINTSESQYKLVWQYTPSTNTPNILAVVGTNKGMFYPLNTNRSSAHTTYWCDQGTVAGYELADTGGHFSSGSDWWAFHIFVVRDPSDASNGIGARLMYI